MGADSAMKLSSTVSRRISFSRRNFSVSPRDCAEMIVDAYSGVLHRALLASPCYEPLAMPVPSPAVMAAPQQVSRAALALPEISG